MAARVSFMALTVTCGLGGHRASPPTMETVKGLVPFFLVPGSKGVAHYLGSVNLNLGKNES